MKDRSLASRLRHTVAIEAPDQIDNRKGGRRANPATGGWVTIAKPWAEIIALRGDEATRNLIERAAQYWRVTIRYRADVKPSHRIVWGAIIMDIKSAAPNDAGDALVMTCESGARG